MNTSVTLIVVKGQFYIPIVDNLFSRDAATLYERLSVRWSVRPLVRWSVRNAFVFRPTRSDLCRVFGLVFYSKTWNIMTEQSEQV